MKKGQFRIASLYIPHIAKRTKPISIYVRQLVFFRCSSSTFFVGRGGCEVQRSFGAWFARETFSGKTRHFFRHLPSANGFEARRSMRAQEAADLSAAVLNLILKLHPEIFQSSVAPEPIKNFVLIFVYKKSLFLFWFWNWQPWRRPRQVLARPEGHVHGRGLHPEDVCQQSLGGV